MSNWLDNIIDNMFMNKYIGVTAIVILTALCLILYANKLRYEDACYAKGGYIYSTQTKSDICSK